MPRRLHLLFAPALGLMLVSRSGAQPGAADHAAPAAQARSAPAEMGVLGRRIAAAAAGDTIEVTGGVYPEHIRIDKPVTVIARGLAILDGGGSGDIVEITAPGVTLRGFTIRNTGIDLDKENAAVRVLAPRTTIEDNTLEDILFGIDLRETVIEHNTIHNGRDAIVWYSTGVEVRNNYAYECRYGLHLMFSDQVTITENEFSRNSVGIYLMYSARVELCQNRLIGNRGPSGYGIGLKEADQFSVRENLIVGNRAGVYIDGSPFTDKKPGEFARNTLAYNDIGITFLPSARGNELTDNNFIDNIDQVSIAGRGSLEANRFWKGERGNFWSDYTGYDQNRDGVGDFVHESQTLFENLMDREPALRLFLFSPAQQAIEFVGRALPAVRPEAKFTDEVPLMRPVPIVFVPGHGEGRGTGLVLLAGGVGLLGLGGGILASARDRERNRDGRHASVVQRAGGMA